VTGGLAALIQEAEALHEALADARTRAGRLTTALRKHRRRERLVSTTLASLKALKLQDVTG
jgi:phosphoribosyl-dephospho-CoA transferase